MTANDVLVALEAKATRDLRCRHVLNERRWPGDDVTEREFLIVAWKPQGTTPAYRYSFQPFQGLSKEITRDQALEELEGR